MLDFNYLYLHFVTRDNLTYIEYDDWGSSRKKYISLITSPLFHALQHEIINMIYIFYIYIYIYIYTYSICNVFHI